jgi:hypothetical protein
VPFVSFVAFVLFVENDVTWQALDTSPSASSLLARIVAAPGRG